MSKPKIRFNGFTEDWEQRKLGDVADIVGGGTPSTGKLEYWDGEIDWYAPAEIADQIFVDSSQRKITKEGYENSSAKMLPIGTVLFTSRAGIGKTAILAKEGCTNQGFQSIVPHQGELDSYFIFSRTDELKSYGETIGAGSTFVEVSGKQMSNMELMMPPTMEEQQAIGALFQQLDHLIALHQRKCDEMKELKKFMLQKMFPQGNSKIPEIRFAGFTDDWEQRKLGEVTSKIGSGKTPKGGTLAYKEDGIALIRSQNVNEDRVDLSDVVFIDEQTDEEMKNSRVLKGDVLLNITGASIGRSAVFTRDLPANVNQHVCIIRPSSADISPEFIQLNIISSVGQNQIDSFQAGGGREGLNFQQIAKMEFSYPSIREQRKIGEYFSSLDHLIALHQQECDGLKQMKKFMLQNMFV